MATHFDSLQINATLLLSDDTRLRLRGSITRDAAGSVSGFLWAQRNTKDDTHYLIGQSVTAWTTDAKGVHSVAGRGAWQMATERRGVGVLFSVQFHDKPDKAGISITEEYGNHRVLLLVKVQDVESGGVSYETLTA